jgi:YD repeat-containing protein
MTKMISMFFAFVLCVYSCISEQKTLEENKRLKKEVQTEFTIDHNGKRTPNGSKTVKIYNENGKIEEEIIERFWAEVQKSGSVRKKYYYDSSGMLVYYDVFSDEKFSLKLVYHYDSLGTLLKTAEINSQGNPGFYSQKIYDSVGLLSEEHLFKPDGALYSVKEYRYDSQKQLLEEKGREGKTWKFRWVYQYNNNHQLIERIDYSGEKKLLRKHQYDYTSERIEVETIFNAAGETERVIQYTYEFW